MDKMMTTKDLLYIDDMFNWNYIILKKLNFYKDNIQNDDILELFKELINMHQNNLNELIKLLKEGA
jgi:hypothetical protein